MAAVYLACPLCQGILEVDSSLAGRQVACPSCQGVVTIPRLESEGPSHAPPPGEPPPFQQPYSEPPSPAGFAELACPHCAGAFQVTPEMEGQQVGCPHCNGLVTIPNLSGPSLATEPPPTFEPPLPAFDSPPVFEPPPFLPTSAPAYSAFSPGMYAPSYEAPQPAGTILPPIESPITAAEAEQQERNLYPPGFEPPVDIQLSRKGKHKKFRAERTPAADALPPATEATSPAVESLLPPGTAGSAPFSVESYPPAVAMPSIDALLPPGATAVPGAPLRPIIVSGTTDTGPTPSSNRPAAEQVLIPTEDGGYIAVHEPVKTVGKPGREIELRRLTPEEKGRRRRVKNLVMAGFCLVVLAITFFLLKNMR